MRIYSKLTIVFLAFIIIPVLFASYIVFYNSKNTIQKEVFSKLDVIAHQELVEIETFFSERKSDLLVLEYQDIYKTTLFVLDRFSQDRLNPSYIEAKKQIDQRLATFQSTYKYVDIILTNMEGKIIYNFNSGHESQIGAYVFDNNDAILKAKTGLYIEDIHKAPHKEHPYVLCLSGPVYADAAKVIGLIHLELDMDVVYKFINDNPGIGQSWETLLVKREPNNKIVFISPLKYEPGAVLTKVININNKVALPAQKSVTAVNGSGFSIDYRGKKVLAAWRSIPLLGWGMITKIDSEEALSSIEKLKELLIIIILITIFSAALAIFSIAKSISDPIQELRRGAEIIGRGNLDYKVGIDENDEVGQLSRAFDIMTENLKRTTTSIDNLDNEVTERKKAEKKLNQALKESFKSREILSSMLDDNNQIREKLEDGFKKLRETQFQLIQSEKMEALGRIAAGVAHEVKNPLGIILQGINYFEAALLPEAKDNRQMLEMMKDSVKRADSIVRALLDFSRYQELKTEPQDINSIIEASINLVRYELKLNSIESVCELEEDLPNMLLDKIKMEQVFINLFNNAADAMPKGGKLHVRSYLSKEKNIIVEVEDNGVGMDEDILSKIFDPFFTTKNRTQGTGLGLSIVKSIIEMHEAMIYVESKKGQGTKLTIVLKIPQKGSG